MARLGSGRHPPSVGFTNVSDDAALRADWHSPHLSRLPQAQAQRVEIMERHDRSTDRGLPNYVDPSSGFSVFTADFLASRGYCCASGCRHCPYVV